MTTPRANDAWYVYAVLEGDTASLPRTGGIVPESPIGWIESAGLAALASLVPRAFFAAGDPDCRAANPAWVAACAQAHHQVVEQACAFGPCLPFGFGTLFASAERVRLWLSDRAERLRTALGQVAGREEWALTLTEDVQTHEAWLRQADPGLRHLDEAARAASPGTGYLLERRLHKACAEARAAHGAAVASRLAERLATLSEAVRQDTPRQGAFTWSMLAAPGVGLPARLEPMEVELRGTGLALRLTGPWPPYAFARAAWQETTHG
jgi:hypothetical protein